MKVKALSSLLSVLFFSLLICCSINKNTTPEVAVKQHLSKQLDSLEYQIQYNLLPLTIKGRADSLRLVFLQCRKAYKRIEWFTEYYAPLSARELNGAPLPEIEIEENKVIPPKGFQVIEEYLYPGPSPESRSELYSEVKAMLSILGKVKTILNATELSQAHITDACRQEIYRVISMGISGFDTPLSQSGIQEASVSVHEVKTVLGYIGDNGKLDNLFSQAVKYLDESPGFNEFDRMTFITRFVNPLTSEILQWQHEKNIEPIEEPAAINNRAATLFSAGALNVNSFTGNMESWLTPEKAELGKVLFSGNLISGRSRNCSSCHKPVLAFSDGLEKSTAIVKGQFVKRNAPTLYYAGYQNAQFYDMRSPTLENQALDVIANKDEMHASVENAAAKLSGIPMYVKKFKTAFPALEKEIKPRHVMIALASYVRSLSPFNSRFDNYMRGDQALLNKEEVKGFNLFMGKGKCGTCHFMPLFNGTAPPSFSSTEAEVLGVPVRPGVNRIDPDSGRYVHNKIEELKFSFKTPTLRNIALTAPYMHNGAYKSLEQVMEFYNKGGGAGIGIKLDNQTLSADPLNLTEAEQRAIIAFLHTLTDREETKKVLQQALSR